MNVIHLDTGREMRGGQELLLEFATGLAARGHRQVVACPGGSPLFAAAQERGLSAVAMERGYLAAVASLRRYGMEPGIILAAHDARAQTISYLASARRPVWRVAHRHVAFPPRNRLIHRWKYTRTCHMVVATSEAAREALMASGVPGKRVQVVRGGIHWPEQLPERVRSGAAGEFVIGHAAAFTPEKGQREAVEALLALLPRHPGLRMILLGEGPLRNDPELQARCAAAGGAVTMPGYRKVDAPFFAGIDLFLANSSSEALGLSVLHAMAHAVPVIASRVGGLPEVVGDSGWLVPPGDVVALAAAIAAAMGDAAGREERGVRGRLRAREFSMAQAVERLEQVYLSLESI